MKRIVSLFLLFFLFIGTSFSQFNVHWRKIRHEVFFGSGTTNFLGDLGGANTIGTHSIKDFDLKSSRWLFQAGYGYKIAEPLAVKASLFYGRLYGSDQFTLEYHRNSRNLHFRSPIIELSGTIEYSIVKERYGHRYDLRRIKGRGNLPNFYVFTGISGIYFNPKGQYTDGKWYALQPLGTEGQGIIPTREKYSRLSIAIPVGIGMNYLVDRNIGVGFDFGFRYAFTDYMDDVSTTYVDPNIFSDPMAAYFSSGTADPAWSGVGPGQQRGQSKYNDSYMFLTLKVSYKLRPRLPGLPKF